MITTYNFYFRARNKTTKSARRHQLRKIYYLLCQCFDMEAYDLYNTYAKFVDFINIYNICICYIHKDDKLVGCTIMSLEKGLFKPIENIFILFLCTHPEHQQTGIAKHMLACIDELSRSMNAKKIRANVRKEIKKNISMFISSNFVPTNATKEYIYFAKEIKK